jgi:hypothetical protein
MWPLVLLDISGSFERDSRTGRREEWIPGSCWRAPRNDGFPYATERAGNGGRSASSAS